MLTSNLYITGSLFHQEELNLFVSLYIEKYASPALEGQTTPSVSVMLIEKMKKKRLCSCLNLFSETGPPVA